MVQNKLCRYGLKCFLDQESEKAVLQNARPLRVQCVRKFEKSAIVKVLEWAVQTNLSAG